MSKQDKVESTDIVIVGNGIAGLTAAVEARRLIPDMSIAIITEQCHPTIHTPALKQFAIGKLTQEQLLAYPAGTEHAQRIHVINGRVEGINAQGKFVYIRDGIGFGYGSLLIATGSVPNSLPAHLPGRDFDGVLTLHCLQDYLNLRRRLDEVDSAVVIGGGAHAVETVMSLLHYGIEVHWLIRGKTFLSQMLDHTASEMVLENARDAGAKVYMKTEVMGIVGRVGSVAGVVTSEYKMIPCQLVLACTGTTPVTTLAEHCDVPMLYKRGIVVDDQFRTNVRDVYAAGDVAAHKNPWTGSYETQAQWQAAVLQGRTVAAMMTGHHQLAAKPLGVRWHATHLGELSMLTVGNPLSEIEGTTILTDSSKRRYCRMSIIDDRLVGYLSLAPAQPDSLAIKRIIDEGLSIRDIKKALLKGIFDAGKYFSQRRSRTVQEIVTSGKLPAVTVNPTQHPLPLVHSLSTMVHPGSPLVKVHPEGVMSGLSSRPTLASEVMPGMRQTHPTSVPVRSSICDQPTIHEWNEELRPVTEKLPAQAKKGVESMLVPLPSRSVSRSLWSYSEKIPAVKRQESSSQNSDTSAETEKAGDDEHMECANFLL